MSDTPPQPNNFQREFLYQSITDIRTTLRAIDAKVGYILVVLFIPITKFDSIINVVTGLLHNSGRYLFGLSAGLALVYAISWCAAIFAAFKTIVGVEPPNAHIRGETPDSEFFPAHIFTIPKVRSLFPWGIKSSRSLETHLDALPTEHSDIIEQLAYEQMKLMFICKLKTVRSSLTYYLTIVWLVSGGLCWMLSFLVSP